MDYLKEWSKIMNKKINNLGIFLQAVLTAAVIISFITSLFIGPLLVVTYALMTLILFVLCYNNYTIYKKKYMTIIYFVVGILLLLITILGEIYGF
jgi:hypothetical protein